MGGGLKMILGPWLMLGVYTLSVPLLIYDSDTMIWKKESSRIRALHMDSLRGFLGIMRMDNVQNA